MRSEASLFWDLIISNNINHLKNQIRWDIFEENFVIYLLENFNFDDEIFNKINWKEFIALVYK
jgi:hypothetical protein